MDGENIVNFNHPERAIYLFGGEDRSVPIVQNSKRIKIPTSYCLNMAVASGVILYDRIIKKEII
jgi:tRNA(Leu) C34 or U34 (ribose-2'-O)-methylase TrmL